LNAATSKNPSFFAFLKYFRLLSGTRSIEITVGPSKSRVFGGVHFREAQYELACLGQSTSGSIEVRENCG
jgi:hypothetical protein